MSSITCVSDEGEIMKNITKHKNNKVKLLLPNWVKNELLEYQKEKHIIMNDFIESSIRKFMEDKYATRNMNVLVSNSLQSSVKVKLPEYLIKQLRTLAKKHKVKISDIVYTALGFSLSNLITELEIMEELTSKDIKGGNYEN